MLLLSLSYFVIRLGSGYSNTASVPFPYLLNNFVRQSMTDQKFWSANGNAQLQLGFLLKYFGPSGTDGPKFLVR